MIGHKGLHDRPQRVRSLAWCCWQADLALRGGRASPANRSLSRHPRANPIGMRNGQVQPTPLSAKGLLTRRSHTVENPGRLSIDEVDTGFDCIRVQADLKDSQGGIVEPDLQWHAVTTEVRTRCGALVEGAAAPLVNEFGARNGPATPTASLAADGADQLFAQAVLDAGGQIEVIIPADQYRG